MRDPYDQQIYLRSTLELELMPAQRTGGASPYLRGAERATFAVDNAHSININSNSPEIYDGVGSEDRYCPVPKRCSVPKRVTTHHILSHLITTCVSKLAICRLDNTAYGGNVDLFRAARKWMHDISSSDPVFSMPMFGGGT